MSTIANAQVDRYPYPRRRPLRYAMRRMATFLLHRLSNLTIVGQENVPETGPIIVVANHFSALDVAAMAACIDRPMEFLGGHHFVNGPRWLMWLPKLYGFYEVHRGSVSRNAMRASTAVLAQKGFLMIFPEGGAWAHVLRPARPGAALLASMTNARILPVGLDGLPQMFPSLRKGFRSEVTIRIGKPFGPLHAEGRGRQRREQLDRLGDDIMQHIATLLPPERRGVYSDDPALRTAAQKVAAYPFDDLHITGPQNRTSGIEPKVE